MISISFLAEKAKLASQRLALLSTTAKNQILEGIAERIEDNIPYILAENKKDIAAGKKKKLPKGLLDRLLLTEDRLNNIAAEVRKVIALKDFVGNIMEARELPNGLMLKKVRVPLGVVGMIYESRPNVTVDAATLCLKSGNAVILKGGSDAINSNRALVKIMKEVLGEAGALDPKSYLEDAVQFIDSDNRRAVEELLKLRDIVDVIIPRGSKRLIDFVRENSTIPVIETGASVVHTYVHEDADVSMAVKIVMNAKLRRVSICNTLDSLLVHKSVAEKFLKTLALALPKNPYKATKLTIKADAEAFNILRKTSKPKVFKLTILKAKPADFHEEFLDYCLAVKVIDSLDQALEHISRHSLKHSEAIVTESANVAQKFLNSVDAACVYWNASTQFSDGAQFGLGSEIGISTQKLHVRGPFALEGLTSYKWVVEGTGQVRNP
jgi:glutamate-5-semialdehyde dehydrogenase